MDHFDLRHSTKVDIVEFEVIDNLSGEKRIHFKDGEPVKLINVLL